VPLASAQEASPDAFVKGLSEDVIAAIRQDKDIQAGDADKISRLVEARILPHFDFRRTTQVAMGVNWRRASADQQERLTSEFKRLRQSLVLGGWSLGGLVTLQSGSPVLTLQTVGYPEYRLGLPTTQPGSGPTGCGFRLPIELRTAGSTPPPSPGASCSTGTAPETRW